MSFIGTTQLKFVFNKRFGGSIKVTLFRFPLIYLFNYFREEKKIESINKMEKTKPNILIFRVICLNFEFKSTHLKIK